MEVVRTFKYLGRVMTADNNDWGAATRNVKRAKERWGRIRRILTRDGAKTRTMGQFYAATVQSILLYGAETWTLTVKMVRCLENFHNRAMRHITGDNIHPVGQVDGMGGEWIYPDMDEVRTKLGMRPILDLINERREKLWEKCGRDNWMIQRGREEDTEEDTMWWDQWGCDSEQEQTPSSLED